MTRGLDAADLEATLRVLRIAHELPEGHPDLVAVQRAAHTFDKSLRKVRRARAREQRRTPIVEHDNAILASTATGSPLRIDDETRGIPLVSQVVGAYAGELRQPRNCYMCHTAYTLVDAFYHWLCPACAELSHRKRTQRADLRGKRALLTGGRAKIGMYIALMLLRDGAELTITTRFPRDAARRFAELADAPEWIDRLTIVGIDLRDPAQVIALADQVAAGGPLDILINNAAQTVRRSPGAYAHLVDAEQAPLPEGPTARIVAFDRISEAHPAALTGALRDSSSRPQAASLGERGSERHRDDRSPSERQRDEEHALSAAAMTSLTLSAGHASVEAYAAGTAVDAGGLLPDTQRVNSWKQKVDQVDPLELLEVQLCNSTAPFLLVSRLRPAMRAAVQAGARRAYVVNVSAMEGQFARRYKGPGHPHTNMAKAALNMMTRTSAGELFATDQILMTAVDTGWITDERPHHEKLRLAGEGWRAPLDLVDGAARVYDPIVRGEAGEDLYGCFVKDFEPAEW